ncbi:ornithine cyclodeaminase family protein [Acinetobacter calcoaceticus]|uniref:ornithine cyclodeaminase family protein n=1 Tax=Acinetobacter calcoaceticus TaxID=471 RepID=UPI0009AC32F1|nr:ornithine cyclodeaminase family protein [Acinetobacter calcoaceticus]AQZ82558.1 ornithine cyclodeaminase family protein [Acinetobacter calcoaceticus]AQZ82677.1 ornithine cyclodeaminase family protein [Acinetobacter calcoaceticus]
MRFISESESSALINHDLAYDAIYEALIAATQPDTKSFPVVHGQASDTKNTFSIKSSANQHLAGLKVGSFWEDNPKNGLPRHNAIILLFNQTNGKMAAAIEAGKVNAFRTAASNAVATNTLARKDSKVLAIFGTGNQAKYECEALAKIRNFDQILIVGRDQSKAEKMAEELKQLGIKIKITDAKEACEQADIIVTATSSQIPLFKAEWVKAGTHISSMGSDKQGKQELPPELFSQSGLFCDLNTQSKVIGEFQHAPEFTTLINIGDVLLANAQGRQSQEQITIYDSSGLSIQDLYIAQKILEIS